MEQDFFSQLESSFSHVGSNECWKREIGGRVVWFSPISVSGDAKIQEVNANSKELGANWLKELKRVTLAHSIVGIDEIDLRKYRDAGQVFGPIQDARDPKKKVMLDLGGYIYMKMISWGSQWMDDAFSVLADLMETHEKENVKNVKFENSKNPVEELGELMVRVTELRTQMKLPPLVEASPAEEPDEVKEFELQMEEEARIAEEKEARVKAKTQTESELEREPEPEAVPFDPFKPVAPAPPNVMDSQRGPMPVPEPERPAFVPFIAPVTTIPAPVQPIQPRAQGIAPRPLASFDDNGPQSTSNSPFQAAPSVAQEVVEQPLARMNIAPPVIDPILAGKNPRFKRGV